MNDLDKIMPKLKKIKGNTGFKVPENYFNEFSLKIQELVSKTEKTGYYYSFGPKLRPRLAYALSFFLIIAFTITGYFLFRDNGTRNYTTEDLIEYIIFTDDDLRNTGLFNELNYNENNENTDEIIEYLVSENIDYSIILE